MYILYIYAFCISFYTLYVHIYVYTMYQLDWSWFASQGTSVGLFLDVSVRVFVDEISISISALSKINCSPQCGLIPSNPLRGQIEQKAEERGIHPFFLLTACAASSPLLTSDWYLHHWLPSSEVFGL